MNRDELANRLAWLIADSANAFEYEDGHPEYEDGHRVLADWFVGRARDVVDAIIEAAAERRKGE